MRFGATTWGPSFEWMRRRDTAGLARLALARFGEGTVGWIVGTRSPATVAKAVGIDFRDGAHGHSRADTHDCPQRAGSVSVDGVRGPVRTSVLGPPAISTGSDACASP